MRERKRDNGNPSRIANGKNDTLVKRKTELSKGQFRSISLIPSSPEPRAKAIIPRRLKFGIEERLSHIVGSDSGALHVRRG